MNPNPYHGLDCDYCNLPGIPRLREGIGNVTFTRTDGRKVTINNVQYETISTVGANAGVVCVELADSDRIVNVPFVQSWTISY